ncbi:MAG: DUF1579 family protein [Planctomycetes bacterium]|nr:DUF1579 family protein [Planctomycetota bacterium]
MSMSDGGPLQPGREHEKLLTKVGEWTVQCTYFWGEEPMTVEGSDRVEALGGFWTLGHFECDTGAIAIRGLATTGFDPEKQRFVGTWQDSTNPYHYYFEGRFDAAGKRLEMVGDNIDPMSGLLVKYRSVETFHDDDNRMLELYVESPTGDEIQVLEYEYTRKS